MGRMRRSAGKIRVWLYTYDYQVVRAGAQDEGYDVVRDERNGKG